MTKAETILRGLNANMSIDREGGYVVGVEDIDDTEGGLYRVGYYSTPSGANAIAFCLENPHATNPYSYETSHVRSSDGLLCLGPGATLTVEDSPLDLRKTVERTRYWAIAFSHLIETGEWVDP